MSDFSASLSLVLYLWNSYDYDSSAYTPLYSDGLSALKISSAFARGHFKSFMTPESEDALKCYTSTKEGHFISERMN